MQEVIGETEQSAEGGDVMMGEEVLGKVVIHMLYEMHSSPEFCS